VVDESGKVVREVKVPSEPVALISCIKSLGVRVERIGLEAGPLSQWLYGALRESGLPVATPKEGSQDAARVKLGREARSKSCHARSYRPHRITVRASPGQGRLLWSD
jgi:hypothetical protein